jgi:hypothetical protein
MSMTEEILEVLIGKYLDGEITPSEQRMLEAELDRNPRAEELLRQFQDLNERSAEVVTLELISRGKSPEEIFERAWRQHSKKPSRRIIRISGWTRFAAGIAAGFIIGFILHFVLPANTISQDQNPEPVQIAQDINTDAPGELPNFPTVLNAQNGEVIRNVDLYNFADAQGNQWLVEGLNENVVRPAVYYGGI